jgi:hypothetical protein
MEKKSLARNDGRAIDMVHITAIHRRQTTVDVSYAVLAAVQPGRHDLPGGVGGWGRGGPSRQRGRCCFFFFFFFFLFGFVQLPVDATRT